MANARPESMTIAAGVPAKTNTSQRKSVAMHGHSSSSSIDSGSGKNVNTNGFNPLPENPLTASGSSTTTDSDFGSEQDDNLQLSLQKSDSSTSNQLPLRDKHFQKLFQTEIHEDMPDLIDSYVCAYQGDILLQGKMYITDRYLCFHSRIINYVTKHVYRWEEIEKVTKERVAFIFPTAIGIQLKDSGKKVTYASFLLRDQAYDKIVSICSGFSSGSHGYDDDDDSDAAHDGTLKATNQNEKTKHYHRESYEMNDARDPEVLQMYLKDNRRSVSSHPRKNSDEKQSGKKGETKLTTKSLSQERKSSNENNNLNPTGRTSRYAKNEQKSNDKSKRTISMVNRRSPSEHRDRTPSQPDNTVPQSNSLSPPVQTPISNSSGILNISISFRNHLRQYLTSLFPSYSMKATIIIFLILTILFLHSFYLIKLAYRIENRLQSLHHVWPSASGMRKSFSSNTKDL